MTDNIIWLDFNDAADQREEPSFDAALLRERLLERVEAVLAFLFPSGKIQGNKFYIGDLQGHPGKSLVVELTGQRRGLWKDFATDEGGDLIDLWAQVHQQCARTDFPAVMTQIQDWLGVAPVVPLPTRPRTPPMKDDLGPHTGKWDYHDADGRLIACIYRFDPPTGKQYRPWDVRTQLWRTPNPRPLYRLPQVISAQQVIIVEGEKCADALCGIGLVATTTMNGAQAPTQKTDWSPLYRKDIVIWPDRDPPGFAYAERVAQACTQAGAKSITVLEPPTDKPEKWDAADAVAEGFDCAQFMASGKRWVVRSGKPAFPTFTLGQLLDDRSPMPPDLIAPRIGTEGGLVVVGGAPKVGKSDFLLTWMVHMAAGVAFLDFIPARALRVFYLQAEVQYHYLRERVQAIALPTAVLKRARDNLVATPQLRLILDEAGVAEVIPMLREAFGDAPIDVLAIDPIRNVFDGGPMGNENDNSAMLFFIQKRVEALRHAINPHALVILAHHTRKLAKKQLEEDPFQALSGAGSLRGIYSAGMVLYRPDENLTTRTLLFELRNGPAPPPMHVDKVRGQWIRVLDSERKILKEQGARMDAERHRKRDVILQIIFEEAQKGNCYTSHQFAETFEGQAGLGGERTIRDRISTLATQGYIKFFRNTADQDLPPLGRTRYGYLCVESMVLNLVSEPDFDTGEITIRAINIYPTHYKCPRSGAALPVENPAVWVYPNETELSQEPA